MDKRSAMAMGLIFLLWMVYFIGFAPKPAQRPAGVPPGVDSLTSLSSTESWREPAGAHLPGTVPGSPAGTDLLTAFATGESAAIEADSTEPVDTVVVTSDLYRYCFITRGGLLVRAYLKNYPAFSPDEKDEKDGMTEHPPVQLIPLSGSRFLASRLFVRNERLNRMDYQDLSALNFKASKYRLSLDSLRMEGSVTFTRALQGGRELKLVYIFRNDSYKIDVNLSLPAVLRASESNRLEVELGPTILSNEKNPKEDYASYEIVYSGEGGKLIDKSLKDLSGSGWSPTGEGNILWGGIRSKYFITAFYVPHDPMVSLSASGSQETNDVSFRGRFPVPSSDKPLHFAVYVGPQAYDHINQLNWGMEKIFEYGWKIIQPFCKICLAVLLWLHKWIDNYGLILIVFALLVKVVFYPLTIKSTKSQIKMQQIQPLMNEVREKFKEEPQKLQQEMMRLYKEHKVNPLGGCLPLLIQMPVLIGLFYVFQRTIEFRGADAFWWIHDLSQPDPLYIWPVAMGITTFLQQKLTPTQADPKMKPMLYIMPFFMTYIFLRFSSGLVMYYTFVNVFQTFQTLYINWRYHGTALPAKAAKKSAPKKAAACPFSSPKKKKKK
ncbi:MAG: membrane protein insertase YidC [Gemmatimonadota bacterium]|nr:membrane protein insertase YidC [Gemmatimonadota bacterium]